MLPALRWRRDSSIVGIQAKVGGHEETSDEFLIPVVGLQSRMSRVAAIVTTITLVVRFGRS